mmetsp:Transcript_8/g.7  ORF Transcript_8/g.7 Transcript_8/m.7 type:complete len:619 (+) Transcript_8:233-2089(+)|eukprot:CAMPEP_0197856320 /NCGR_PEP_ID=MMETSP1438-20131217/28360_1 /TAXON_ID=1461541 /ORGANISM="Pterosperma sp., Strain CCMP1384" /LENGTH=618 /DNA_ID=CAMNT_0043471741 /DNA_START=233 /DNA_END=2089 /DNA_ORIENTATION=-
MEALLAKNAEEKAAKEAAKAAKKAAAEAKRAAKKAEKAKGKGVPDMNDLDLEEKGEELTEEQKIVAGIRAVTGVLASPKVSMNVKFQAFSVSIAGNMLVTDTDMELNQECRYGLIGQNGSGKSNILSALAQREVPIPSHVDLFHLHEEAAPTEQTAVEAVIAHVKEEGERLEALSDAIMEESGPEDERIFAISDRIAELDPVGAEPRARKILSGLGFADHLVPMDRKTKHMSGGWRMRVSLAKALFAAPSLLLLDEPTNHLDLEACVWLESHLATYPKCLLVISHSQDFLNAVCTHTIWLNKTKLIYYGGNYNTFCKQVEQEERVQMKQYEKQQADMEKLQNYVLANKANQQAKSAASKEKVLAKIQSEAVERPQIRKSDLSFRFQECARLAPPVLPFDDVAFSYSGKKEDYLYEKLNIGVDCDSRIALVGPNGCGKSTLLKLMSRDLNPTEGVVGQHQHLLLGRYHQHSKELLDPDMNPLAFMKKMFPPSEVKRSEEHWRSYLDSFGFTAKHHTTEIGKLSDGQKSRLVFAMICMKQPNVLLLDEPTNHLDVEAIDSLAAAIKEYKGGVVLVSHDFRLIDQVADTIWECKDKSVKKYNGTIHEYKAKLAKKMGIYKV